MKRTALLLMTSLLLLTACQESKRERFEREAREFTAKNCPRAEFEDLIYLDSLVCPNDGSNTITYYYSIHGDSASMAEMTNKYDDLYGALLGAVRNSVDLRHVKAEGLDIVYSYYNSETGEEITSFTFTKEEYN
ncbi:MAG: hypothetical protein IKN15_14010 [Bacteroidaceae bacterium]|jgi:hypothetical protein|nr:hypothetical protein [Bacteroidaceae bacterium]